MADTKISEILERLYETHNRTGELLDELRAIVAKEPTPGQEAKRLLDYFVKHWERKYRAKMVVNGKKDMGALKQLLTKLTMDDIAARIVVFFKTDDRFFAESKHSIGAFISNVNKLAARPAQTWVVGCKHTPRCTNEAQCTALDVLESRRA